MTDDDLAIYTDCTGRTKAPTSPATEAWLCVGRRSGKSFITALVAVYLATIRDWSPYLIPGERGVIAVVAVNRSQSRIIFNYCRALLNEVPLLAPLIENETRDTIDLTNGISISIGTNSQRSLRGQTIVAALCDEIAHWSSDTDAANPDAEVIDGALRPAMATVPGSMLIAVSSPHARRGMLYSAFKEHHDKDDDPVLYWKAPSRTMNPTLRQSVVDKALNRDRSRGAAEFLAEFRSDVEAFITLEAIEMNTVPNRIELPPVEGVTYQAFVDPSGGARDGFTLGIGHREDNVAVLDAVRETRPPFSPDAVTKEFSTLLKTYGCRTVTGDRYAGQWPRERFQEHGVTYETSQRTKSEIYLALLPELNSNRVELLDNHRLAGELVSLERRTARGGRDSVDHPPSGRDDLCNAAAGVLGLCAAPSFTRRAIQIRM